MIIFGWIYWIIYQVISLCLMVVGWPLLAILSLSKAWTFAPSTVDYWGARSVWQWKGGWLTWIWGNQEDGIVPPGTTTPTPAVAWKWAAWRNSVNDMRFLPGAFFLIDSAKLTVKTHSWGYVATQGWRQCISFGPIRIGWLIKADAVTGWYAWPIIQA